jgi:nicotinate-nucleotide adenylyltransferase
MSLINFIKNNSVLAKSDELIFFGGSFNPWHDGHSSCLRLAPKNWPIIVIPDHNPFKDLVNSGDKVSSIDEIQDQLSVIDRTSYLFDEYLVQNQKNPSHKWIAEIRDLFPNKKISLLMGFDTFISIDRWIKADSILNILDTLYIASRLDDENVKKNQINNLNKINPNLSINFIGHHDYEDLSSSKIREDLIKADDKT